MTEIILKRVPDALPHCMYYLNMSEKKVHVTCLTNKGLINKEDWDIDEQNIGVFLNISSISVYDCTGLFIAQVNEGNVTGVKKISKRNCKIDVWLKETNYLFE